MLNLVVSRLFQGCVVLIVVGFLSFALFAFIGDPVIIMLGTDYTQEQYQAAVRELGLDQPLPVQFARFMGSVVQGEFGMSYRLGRPVSTLIAGRVPATFELALAAAVIAATAGIALGILTAIHPRNLLARALSFLSLAGVSLPTFLVGILLILVFSVMLGWLPTFGRGEVVPVGSWWTTGLLTSSGLKSLILPACTLALYQLAVISRLIRGQMIDVLRSDHIRFARARGIPPAQLYLSYALRNTLVPVITVIGMQFGGLIAFAIVTETVFQWPGLGQLLVQSISVADIPVMGAYLLLVSALFVAINFVVDLLYFLCDPRLRIGGS
jgi:peptide/nickel transport system permease protein